MSKRKLKEKRSLGKDPNESLVEPVKLAVKDLWDEAWIDPNVEDFRLLKYANLTLRAVTFLNYAFNKSEGSFGMTRYLRAAPEVEIGVISTSYGGIEGTVLDQLTIPTVGETVSSLDIKQRLYPTLKNLLTKTKDKGLEVYKWYIKRPQEKVPELYEKGKEVSVEKYYLLLDDPWDYVQELMIIPERMYNLWSKRLGSEVIQDATVQMNYSNEFGLLVTKTREANITGTQKEIRLTLEAMVNIKNVGETGEAIGSSGGIDSLKFYHPLKLNKYVGWEAIEALGEWVADKAQGLQRAEKPDDVFEDRQINVLMPGTIIGAAMSYFFSGKKMWEAIKGEKKLQLHKLVGQKIAPENFDLILDGRQETSWDSDLYGTLEMDSEGTQASEKILVKSGKLVRFLNSRLYFLPVAERTALGKTLIEEENPLTATARKESAKALPDTVATNLYIKPNSDLTIEGLLNKLGKQRTHLYVISSSLSGVDLENGKITIRVDQGHPIQGGKINQDIIVGSMNLTLDFNRIVEKLKYIGGPSTMVTHAFNLEVDGSTYEVSVTSPYVDVFEVEKRSGGYYGMEEVNDLFTSQHLYTKALPRYLTMKHHFVEKYPELIMPESLKNIGIIFQPIVTYKFAKGKAEVLKPIRFK
jgi:predicted Zn-dependent protease